MRRCESDLGSSVDRDQLPLLTQGAFATVVRRDADDGVGDCEHRLVDLSADPDELDDRSTEPAARAHRDRLAAKLDAFWRRESAFVPSGPLPTRLPRARIGLPVKD